MWYGTIDRSVPIPGFSEEDAMKVLQSLVVVLLAGPVVWGAGPRKTVTAAADEGANGTIPELIQKLNEVFKGMEKRFSALEEQLAALKAENAALKAEIAQLRSAFESRKVHAAGPPDVPTPETPVEPPKEKPPRKPDAPPDVKPDKKPPEVGGKRQVLLGIAVKEEDSGGRTQLVVMEIEEGFAGEAAGLSGGCTLLRFNGKELSSLNDLQSALKGVMTGDRFTIVYKKDGVVFEKKVLGSHLRGESRLVVEKEPPPEKPVEKPPAEAPQEKPDQTAGEEKPAQQQSTDNHQYRVLGVLWKPGDEKELTVLAVLKGSPADKAGIRPDDTLLTIEGKKVDGLRECLRILETMGGKKRLTLKVKHPDGKTEDVVVALDEPTPEKVERPKEQNRPEDKKPDEPEGVVLDIEIEDNGEFIKVIKVLEGGPCEGRLRSGDIIVVLAGKTIQDLKGLQEAVNSAQPGKEMTITVLRDGRKVDVQVVPAGR